ncbi:hypothetical protein [Desulfoferrobacter suflitae]|uniref:hypothetical protein n=1 Tax=Desulfoferrobacter suflitae TaxID=2865782 RepID=UPI0021647253|nr:hypothetical protein [Desulfoferrobacter suflitae]MCK8600257.1 hypothetical protein [Desulfoferrobacter suflitae]
MLILVSLIVGVPLAGGAAHASQQVDPIELSLGKGTGSRQTEDVVIEYRFSVSAGTLTVSGKVGFTAQVSDTFNTVDYFNLRIVLFDRAGKRLDMMELLTKTDFSSRSGALNFGKVLALPQGASAFTFAYAGQAHSASTGDAIPFSKSFHYTPPRSLTLPK